MSLLPRRIVIVRHAQSKGNVDPFQYTYVPDPSVPLVSSVASAAQRAGTYRLDSTRPRACHAPCLAHVSVPYSQPYPLPSAPLYPSSSPQTAKGWDQAIEAGEQLRRVLAGDEDPRVFCYTSPYLRCKQVRAAAVHGRGAELWGG